MKKFCILTLAVAMVAMLTVPAAATEIKVDGSFNAKWYVCEDLNGMDSPTGDYNYMQSRARINVDFVVSDDVKFKTRFELGDDKWGDASDATNFMDFGTDGVAVEVARAFMDFNLGPANLKVGAMYFGWGRDFMLDTDAAGIKLTFNPSDTITLPFYWAKKYDVGSGGTNRKTSDVDVFMFVPGITVSEGITVTPAAMWVTSDDVAQSGEVDVAGFTPEELDVYYLGLDVDAKFGPVGAWFCAAMESGSSDGVNILGEDDSYDYSGYAVALGGSYTMDTFDVSAMFQMLSGDDPDTADEDEGYGDNLIGNWFAAWSYILGDDAIGPGDGAAPYNNVMTVGLGAGVKLSDTVSLNGDVYWAQLIETTDDEESDLGIELNTKCSIALVDGVKLDLLGAYLFAGDGFHGGGDDTTNPYEMAAELTLSF